MFCDLIFLRTEGGMWGAGGINKIKMYKRAYKQARKNEVCMYNELLLESLID